MTLDTKTKKGRLLHHKKKLTNEKLLYIMWKYDILDKIANFVVSEKKQLLNEENITYVTYINRRKDFEKTHKHLLFNI